jgi:CheY-like chemotaxis protein
VQFAQFDADLERTMAVPPGRILIVDDDPAVRASLKRLLDRKYAVTVATDGREALELLACESFEVILSDVDMPVMNGLALRDEVRAVFPHLADRFLMMSGGGSDWLTMDSTIRFIAKPFTGDEIETAIENLLNG